MSSIDSSPPPTPLPLHLVTHDSAGKELLIKRRPGRPRKVVPAPSAVESDYIEQINTARDRHIEGDPLVASLGGREDTGRVLRAIIEALAREAASLRWEIRRGREAGRDTAQLCSRRIDALSKIALVYLGLRRLGDGHELARNDPHMTTIINFFVGTVTGVLAETLPRDQGATLSGKIEARIQAWQRDDDP
jgi:hypothetical protein